MRPTGDEESVGEMGSAVKWEGEARQPAFEKGIRCEDVGVVGGPDF